VAEVTDIPHFDLPFRMAYQHGVPSAVEVDQDTNDDVFNCVVAIVRTHVGFRPEVPDFGLSDLVFVVQPLDTDSLQADITIQEPRASVLIKEMPTYMDELEAHLVIQASKREAESA